MSTNTTLRNVLSHTQAWQLYRWWDLNSEEYKSLTRDDIAEFAQEALAFPVSKSNIALAMRITGKRNSPNASKVASQIRHDKIRIIAVELVNLMEALRQKGLRINPSTELLQLSGRPNGQ